MIIIIQFLVLINMIKNVDILMELDVRNYISRKRKIILLPTLSKI